MASLLKYKTLPDLGWCLDPSRKISTWETNCHVSLLQRWLSVSRVAVCSHCHSSCLRIVTGMIFLIPKAKGKRKKSQNSKPVRKRTLDFYIDFQCTNFCSL